MALSDNKEREIYSLNPELLPDELPQYSDYSILKEDPLTAAILMAREAGITDTRRGTGPYKGIVVRVEDDLDGAVDAVNPVWVREYYKSRQAALNLASRAVGRDLSKAYVPDPLHAYKIWVPELDICATPSTTLKFEDKTAADLYDEHEKIDRLRTYIARSSNIAKANHGDIVLVDFGDQINFKDPQYIGPVFQTNESPAIQQVRESASKAFNRLQTSTKKKLAAIKSQIMDGKEGEDCSLTTESKGGTWTKDAEGKIYCKGTESTPGEEVTRRAEYMVENKRFENLLEGFFTMGKVANDVFWQNVLFSKSNATPVELPTVPNPDADRDLDPLVQTTAASPIAQRSKDEIMNTRSISKVEFESLTTAEKASWFWANF